MIRAMAAATVAIARPAQEDHCPIACFPSDSGSQPAMLTSAFHVNATIPPMYSGYEQLAHIYHIVASVFARIYRNLESIVTNVMRSEKAETGRPRNLLCPDPEVNCPSDNENLKAKKADEKPKVAYPYQYIQTTFF